MFCLFVLTWCVVSVIHLIIGGVECYRTREIHTQKSVAQHVFQNFCAITIFTASLIAICMWCWDGTWPKDPSAEKDSPRILFLKFKWSCDDLKGYPSGAISKLDSCCEADVEGCACEKSFELGIRGLSTSLRGNVSPGDMNHFSTHLLHSTFLLFVMFYLFLSLPILKVQWSLSFLLWAPPCFFALRSSECAQCFTGVLVCLEEACVLRVRRWGILLPAEPLQSLEKYCATERPKNLKIVALSWDK